MRLSCRQRPPQRSNIDAEQFSDRAAALFAGCDQLTGMLNLLPGELRRAAYMLAAPFRRAHSGLRALPYQAALEFSESAHHVKNKSTARCRRIDGFRERGETYASFS